MSLGQSLMLVLLVSCNKSLLSKCWAWSNEKICKKEVDECYHIYPPENWCSLLVSLIFQKKFILRANPSTKTCSPWVLFSQNFTTGVVAKLQQKPWSSLGHVFWTASFTTKKCFQCITTRWLLQKKCQYAGGSGKWQVGGTTPGRTSMQTSKHI